MPTSGAGGVNVYIFSWRSPCWLCFRSSVRASLLFFFYYLNAQNS